MISPDKTNHLLKYFLLLIWLALNISNLFVGLADNGDWVRLATWFAPTPVGFAPLWVDHTSPQYLDRYFTYWLPFWTIDFSQQGLIFSSILLLWLPGLFLNMLFFSSSILYMPWLSLVPRLLVFIFLLGVFHWIDNHTQYKKLLYLTLGIPLVFITSTTDYVAYFNTFFQETGAFIGLLFLLWSVYALRERFTLLRLCCFSLALLFLTLVRASSLYWPLLSVPFILPFQKLRRAPYAWIPLAILLIVIPSWLSIKFTSDTGMQRINNLDTIYTGILPFSTNPQAHMTRFQLTGSEQCIDNIDYFSQSRTFCISQYQPQLSRLTAIRIILAEPAILLRQFNYVSTQMQQIKLAGFTYPPFNLNNDMPGYDLSAWSPLLNLWGNLKSALFPRGVWLFLSLILFLAIFVTSTRLPAPASHLAWLGILLLAGLLIDMMVAINGDGKYELVKHLYLANLLFDLVFLLATNLLIAQIHQKLHHGDHLLFPRFHLD